MCIMFCEVPLTLVMPLSAHVLVFLYYEYARTVMFVDGLELAAAMTHFHNEDGSQSKPPTLSDDQLAQIVDQVLRDDDMNDDGYVDYYEFVRAQKMDKELALKKNEGA